VSAAPPASGGIALVDALNILAGFDMAQLDTAARKHLVVEAMRRVHRDRSIYLGDPDFVKIPVERLTSRFYADGQRASIRLDRAMPSDALPGLASEAAQGMQTTHFSVLDRDGNRVAGTITINTWFGTGLMVPGTGVILNNMLGEEDLNPLGFHAIEPGHRVPSMMAPTVVLRNGEIEVGLGSAGSNRIRSAILQTVVRVVEQGMAAADAVRAPRLHYEQGIVQAEPGIDEAALERIEAGGVPVLRRPRLNLYFGGVQAVARDPATGELSGGGDPRRGGAVAMA
jgi:gamma-glutamyltranspeptidase/glutathione hydrolase